MNLSREQRWMLANQYRILEKLYPEEADHYERAREVLERGFTLNFDDYIPHIYERTMSEDACKGSPATGAEPGSGCAPGTP